MFSRRALLCTSILLSFTVLSACHRPERVQTSSAGDSSLDCAGIQREMNYAEQAKARAREHDRFEFRYMLIVPAFVSAYNFHKAEKAADERIENLQQLYNAKNCANQPPSQYYQQQPSPYNGASPFGSQYNSPYNYPYSGQPQMMPGMNGGMGQPPMMPGMNGGMGQPPMMPGMNGGGMMGDPMMNDPMMPGPGGEMPPPAPYPGY